MKFFDFASKHSIIWANAGHVVANVNVVASEEFAKLPYRKDYADVANHVVFFEPNPYSTRSATASSARSTCSWRAIRIPPPPTTASWARSSRSSRSEIRPFPAGGP